LLFAFTQFHKSADVFIIPITGSTCCKIAPRQPYTASREPELRFVLQRRRWRHDDEQRYDAAALTVSNFLIVHMMVR
jgi:hypothetical protein